MFRVLLYRIKRYLLILRNKNVSISKKSEIAMNTTVSAYGSGKVVIGDDFIIRSNSSIAASAGGHIEIGNGVFINRNCVICSREKIIIANNCIIGPNVCIYDHNHKFSMTGVEKNEFSTGEIVIDEGVWIGAGAIILKGIQIGTGAIIGAGCVVKENVPPHTILTAPAESNIMIKIEERL